MAYGLKSISASTHHKAAHWLHIGVYVLIAVMYFLLTAEYGKKTEGKDHKYQYTWIGIAYMLLAGIVIYELTMPSGHGHGHGNDGSASGSPEAQSLTGNKENAYYY